MATRLMEELTGSDKDRGLPSVSSIAVAYHVNRVAMCSITFNLKGFTSCGVEHTIFLERKESWLC